MIEAAKTSKPTVRIGIVSHNRASILPKAIESALSQDWPHKEIWVIDDGSRDETHLLRKKYPNIRWTRNEHPLGYRDARNLMMSAADADFFVSLDDDSWFLEDDAISRGMEKMIQTPRLGAIGYTILDHSNPALGGRGRARAAQTFIGCGHLLRLEAVAEVDFYSPVPGAYGGEEKDLSIQLLEAGWDVWELPGVHVWHDKTMTARNVASQHRSGVCNDLAFALKRCPFPQILGVIPGKILNHLYFALRFALRPSSDSGGFDQWVRQQLGSCCFLRPTVSGLFSFSHNFFALSQSRKPVSPEIWRQYLLRAHTPRPNYPTELPSRVAISITTRNRMHDLQRTLEVLEKLKPAPEEILVVADGCEDGTVAMLEQRYPRVTRIIHDTNRGSIPSRDEILRTTSCEIVLSLDDDSYPIETDCVQRLRCLFADNPGVAIFTFPQITNEFPESFTQITAQRGERAWVGSFTNSGAALRRSVYLKLPGYVGEFHHAYEEPDYALQCIAAGYGVMLEPSLTIRHHYSRSSRNELRTHRFHSRNELWSVLLRCPLGLIPFVAPFRVARQFLYALRRGFTWVSAEPQWWWAAARGIHRIFKKRNPLSHRAYWQWMRRVRAAKPMGNAELVDRIMNG